MKQILHSKRVITPNGIHDLSIIIEDGKIVELREGLIDEGDKVIDVGEAVIMPGLVDVHTHINEPGRTDWEGFETATHAAAVGGITTLVDMPLNSSPVTVNVAAFEEKLAAAKGKLNVNCGFWGGLVPESGDDLEELLKSGVLGIKVFLSHSGIDEFPNVTRADLEKAMPLIQKYDLPILAHCEIVESHAEDHLIKAQPFSYDAYRRSRPKDWELKAINLMIELCKATQCRTHIVHLAADTPIPIIKAAREAGLPLTVETCPHYLYFAAETIPDQQTIYKCAPPIRGASTQEALWTALEGGVLDFIATDHSPAPPAIKLLDTGNLEKAWGGIAGLQCLLPAVWTKAKLRNIGLVKIAEWLSTAPAAFAGLGDYKGKIAIGYDADLVIWEPETAFTLSQADIQHRHKVSPYIGQQFYGKVLSTYIKGKCIVESGILVKQGKGQIILKKS